MILRSLDQAVKKSLDASETQEHDAIFVVYVNDGVWVCYTAAISYREITLYCDKGTATYMVDTYGDRVAVELFDWEKVTS